MMTHLPDESSGSATYLQHMLAHRFPDQFMVFADMFAMGCLLHFQGEHCVADKLILQVLDMVHCPVDSQYLAALRYRLAGNELRFALEINPSLEITELCRRAATAPAREVACDR